MKDLHDSCEEVKFPDDKDFYPIFTSTTIHWRKTNSDAIDTLASAVENLSIDKAASD